MIQDITDTFIFGRLRLTPMYLSDKYLLGTQYISGTVSQNFCKIAVGNFCSSTGERYDEKEENTPKKISNERDAIL